MARGKITIYRPDEIAGVRAAAQASATVLARLCDAVIPGMTTAEVDLLAEEFIRDTGGKSAFLGYQGYPGQICVSLNDEVVHGIGRPDRVIAAGDIVSLDVGVSLGGYVGDNARSICAGQEPSGVAADLLRVTEEALQAGIAQAREGRCVNDIGQAVEQVAKRAGFSVVRDMVGHGCGRHMHEPPEVPNYRQPGRSPSLRAGMILAIEPMINVGTWRINIDRHDGWTVRSADGSLSAHFEHQILITQKQAEVLTWVKTA
jgi:methionyl aminopeptidase